MASSLNLKPLSAASGKPSALASGRSKFSSATEQQAESTSPRGLRHKISALLGEKGSGLIQGYEKVGAGKKIKERENPVARLKLLLVCLVRRFVVEVIR